MSKSSTNQLDKIFTAIPSSETRFAFPKTEALKNLALLIPCMKMILRADQNPCRDVALLRLYIQIHTSIQQRQKSLAILTHR